jgi:hypothetical protein
MSDDIFKIRKGRKRPKIGPSNVYELPNDKNVKKLVERARAISAQLDEVKPLYNELDQITLALAMVKDKLPKHGVTMVDNFSAKNTQFKVASFRRFELRWAHVASISAQRVK